MSSDWATVLSGEDAAGALTVACEVGERLRDPRRLAGAIEAASREGSSPGFVGWEPSFLAEGHAGLALTFAHLGRCFPGERWDRSAHGQLEQAVAALRTERAAHAGLYSGLAGVAFAAVLLDAGRYARLLASLDGLIARHTDAMIRWLDGREHGCAEHDFDLISGLAGVGAYALLRADDALLRRILSRLVDLILADGELPGWQTPHELLDEYAQPRYPAGRMNCGLAHGLPGPLALLALASSSGYAVDGLRPAIERAARWLVEQAAEDEWGADWPAVVPLGPDATREQPARAGWCYGAPGVTRALWLAGEAMEDSTLQQSALDAVTGVFRRPADRLRTAAPGLCHGTAGLLQTSARFANDTGHPELREAAARLARSLTDRFEPATILGYRAVGPEGEPVENAGLLEGAPGVVLSLLAAATPVPPLWDRMLLLA